MHRASPWQSLTHPCLALTGSVIGTASLRRQAQLYAINPSFKCVNFRGNVQTRLKKLQARPVPRLARLVRARAVTRVLTGRAEEAAGGLSGARRKVGAQTTLSEPQAS